MDKLCYTSKRKKIEINRKNRMITNKSSEHCSKENNTNSKLTKQQKNIKKFYTNNYKYQDNLNKKNTIFGIVIKKQESIFSAMLFYGCRLKHNCGNVGCSAEFCYYMNKRLEREFAKTNFKDYNKTITNNNINHPIVDPNVQCSNCTTIFTCLWREMESKVYCNACYVHYKKHNSHRPKTLKATKPVHRRTKASKNKK